MNLCVVSTYNGTKEDYLKLYESFKDDIAKYTDVRFFSIICILSIAAFWFVLPDSNYVLFCLFLLFLGSIS